jgi:predicted enzyme related to lactoylglutathione lyase
MHTLTRFVGILVLVTSAWAFAQTSEPERPQDSAQAKADAKGRATGIGGIFFKSKDPAKMREWYAEHLGLATNEYGSMFEFREGAAPHDIGYLQWSPFNEKTGYFAPSEREFMINYRVKNMDALIDQLRAAGVTIVDSVESYSYGRFVHIMDPEGNKLELWEPMDSTFTELYEGQTTK